MPCYEIDGLRPVIHPSAYVHPDAVLIGDVIIGPRCYVAPLASLRGDFGRIVLEEGSNIQDTCVMHGFPGTDTVIEVDGHVGHGAVLHGCRVGRNALIGMNAVIMDKASIGESTIVAACAFVKAGLEIPARKLVAGMPAKIVRDLSEQEIAWKIDGTRCYQDLTVRSLASLRPCEPLTEIEAGRTRFEFPGVIPLTDVKKGS
ncbi:phenylacetic acid degradation protein PaaY [Azoarcus communis]|uniref:phenylacetic acid degradation protein PaaY n=1 Tax=Parazoarcus communis TaxID=41977 RepID=UPI0014599EED|nr:phenylacetic acid degradation protein PaaY [Parazoarcus communis]NMG49924.1 phenylacetic acid degradation protein PaaY [Parazoarcus communis]